MILRYTLNNAIEGEHICTYSPKGWEDTELVLKRHDKYEGIFKDYTVKVEFFCGAGKEYIDNIYDTQGIEAEVTVLIEMDCDESGTFETLYEGKLIMKSYEKVSAAPEFTRVNLEQDGIIQTVLNRLETKISLSSTETLDGTEVDTTWDHLNYDLTMHSKAFSLISEWQVWVTEDDGVFASGIFNPGDTVVVDIPLETITSDISTTFSVVSNFEVGATPQPLFENNEVLDSLELEYRIKGTFTLNTAALGKYEILNFSIWKVFTSTTALYTTNSGGQFTGVLSYDIPFDVIGSETFSSPADGQELKFYITIEMAPGDFPDIDPLDDIPFSITLTLDEETTVSINGVSVESESTSKASGIFEVGADIARKITNQADAFRSNYFGRTNSEPINTM
jgi:hypothetical protein